MVRRRGTKQPGTPVTIYLDAYDTQSYLLAAQRENITLEQAVHAVAHGRNDIRAELHKLPMFQNRLVTMAEGGGVILSLIKAEVIRQVECQIQQESKDQTRSMPIIHQGDTP